MKNGQLPASVLQSIPWASGQYMHMDWLGALIALGEGFKDTFGYYPPITEAYRTLAKQEALFKKYGYPRAQYPGHSNHGLGTAVDFGGGINSYKSPQWHWMNTEGRKAKYGAWRPLNEKNLSFEPWHWTPTQMVLLEEESLDMLTKQDIMNAVAATAMSSAQFADAIRKIVWIDTKVNRGGKQVSVIQEIADAKTSAVVANAKADTILDIVSRDHNLDPEGIKAAVEDAVKKALEEAKVTVEVDLGGK